MADESLIAGATQPAGDASAVAAPQAAADAQAPAATEQQGAAGQTAAGDAPAASETAPSVLGAPEAYAFTAPEGASVDAVVLDELSAVARELDLSQGAAQTLIDRLAPKLAERAIAAQTEALAAVTAEWQTAAKADTEFGGEAIGANLAVAKKALDAFGTPELRTLLETTGLGNHPEIIRAFYRAGKQLNEDSFLPGSTRPNAAPRSAATALYGNQKH